MDDRLQKALEHVNYKATILQQKDNLKVRFANALLHAEAGGIFTVTQQLVCFVDCLIRQGQDSAILIDDKGNPIRIDDLRRFLDKIASVYAEATNEFFCDYETLRKARNVKSAVGL